MLPWIKLDEATVPGGGALRLMQRGGEFSIMSGTIELMNSRLSGSEEQLATLSAARIAGHKAPRILIGGLGMGFTLRAALHSFGADSEITVAELVPEVVAWARGPLNAIHGASLDDPRVKLHEGDVATAHQVVDAEFSGGARLLIEHLERAGIWDDDDNAATSTGEPAGAATS